MTTSTIDWTVHIEQTLGLMAIEPETEQLAAVVEQFEQLATIAQLVMDFPVDSPVFWASFEP